MAQPRPVNGSGCFRMLTGWLVGRLELGAGGGLVGLAVALECRGQQSATAPATATATGKELHPILITDQLHMLDLMRHNTHINNVEDRVKPLILNWCVSTDSIITGW